MTAVSVRFLALLCFGCVSSSLWTIGACDYTCNNKKYLSMADSVRKVFDQYHGEFNRGNLDKAFHCLQDNGEVSKKTIWECLTLVGLPDVDLAKFFNRKYLLAAKDREALSCCVAERTTRRQTYHRSQKMRDEIYKGCIGPSVKDKTLKKKCLVYKLFPGLPIPTKDAVCEH